MAKHQPGKSSNQQYVFFNKNVPVQETFNEQSIIAFKNKAEEVYKDYNCTNINWWCTLNNIEQSLLKAAKYRVTKFCNLEPGHYRWWLDHYIREIGFQLWNDISYMVYREHGDTRISDKAADEARKKFFSNFE